MDVFTAVLGVAVPVSAYLSSKLASRTTKETAHETVGGTMAAAALNSLNQQIAQLGNQVNQQAARLDSQSTTIDLLRATIETLKDRVRVLEDEKRELLADHSQEKAYLESEIEKLRTRLEEKDVHAVQRDMTIGHLRETQQTLCTWISSHGVAEGDNIVIGGIEIALMAERQKASGVVAVLPTGDLYRPVSEPLASDGC